MAGQSKDELKEYRCKQCDKLFLSKRSLNRHLKCIHNPNIILIPCDLCELKFKTNSNLKRHKSNIHNINVRWFLCDLCNFKTKNKDNFKQHKLYSHSMNIIWYKCNIEKCVAQFKSIYKLNDHKSYIHLINVKWYWCDIDNCNAKFKRNNKLIQHKSNIHSIAIIWHYCDIENCIYKCKTSENLKRHMKTHNIGVVWHKCNIENCTEKFKETGNLTRHKELIHDIGKHECEICYNNRNSSIDHEEQKICRDCYKKLTGFTSRVEKVWSEYIDKNFGTEFLSSSDKNLKSLGGCQLYRPDKLYISDTFVLMLECDEHQHRGIDYLCDEKRISEIYDEDGICGKKMIVIRWNPDKYNKTTMKKRNIRLKEIVTLMKKVIESPPDDMIFVYYMYYDDPTNAKSDEIKEKIESRLVKSIPYELVY